MAERVEKGVKTEATTEASDKNEVSAEPGNVNISEMQDPDQGDFDEDEGNHRQRGGGRHQENLLTKVVAFDQKSYFLDVRENARGKYLKLTESSQRRRSTILISGFVLKTLQSVLDDAIKENYTSDVKFDELDNHWVTILSRRVLSMHKKIYIDLMQNRRGRSLNIAEVSSNRPKTSVIMSERGWFQFKRALEEIQERFPEFGNNNNASQRPTKSHNRQTTSPAANPAQEKKHETNNNNNTPNSTTQVLANRKLSVQSKHFFFDFLENDLGRYCKVSEVRRGKRETLFIPNVCFDIFGRLLELFMANDFDTMVDGAEVAELPESDSENHSTLTRRIITVEGEDDAAGRKYNIDLRENSYGRFLRVTELRPNRSNCVFFPSEQFEEIKQIFNDFNNMP